MKNHTRTTSHSTHISLKKPSITPIDYYFLLPEILPFFYPSKKSLDFKLFCKKARLFQAFYIDESSLLCESLEKTLNSSKKPAGFFESLEKTILSFEKTQLFQEIMEIKKKSTDFESFEAELQVFLIKLRLSERKTNFQAFFNASFKQNKSNDMKECLLFLKTESLFLKSPENLEILLEEGLKISFRSGILDTIEKTNPHQELLKKLAGPSEKELISSIKSMRYDPHCEQAEFEALMQFCKRYEVNDFSRKLLFLIRMNEGIFLEKANEFLIEIRELLRTYDFVNIEAFLGNLLEIMRKSLPFCNVDFQKSLQMLIEDLKLTGTLETEERAETMASQTSLLDASFTSNTKKVESPLKMRNFFKDDLFLTDFSSIFNNRKNPKYPEWINIRWFRLSEAFPSILTEKINNKFIYFQDPGFSLTSQTFLQHKYLFAVFKTLENRPKILKRLFVDQKISRKGQYSVRICQDGVWKSVIIDDFVPCVKQGKGYNGAFLKCEGMVWPVLLEKTLAKIYRSYESLEKGDSGETLRDLTGAPFEKIMLDPMPDLQVLYSQLQNFLCLKFILLLKPKTDDCEWEILRVFSQTEELLEICPSFPSNSDVFNEILAHSKQFDKKPEGIFIKLTEIHEFFSVLQVSKFHRNYYYSSSPISHLSDAFSVRSLEKTRPGHCYIELTQLDKRYFREKLAYDYTFARLIIAKRLNFLENSQDLLSLNEPPEKSKKKALNFAYVDGISGKARNLSLELFLDPGVYYILVILDKNRGGQSEACLSYYGEEKTKFERENYQGNSKLFGEIMKEVVWKYGRKIDLGRGLMVQSYVSLKDAMIVEMFNNENEGGGVEFMREGKLVRLKPREEKLFLKKLEKGKELMQVYQMLNEEYLKVFA